MLQKCLHCGEECHRFTELDQLWREDAFRVGNQPNLIAIIRVGHVCRGNESDFSRYHIWAKCGCNGPEYLRLDLKNRRVNGMKVDAENEVEITTRNLVSHVEQVETILFY